MSRSTLIPTDALDLSKRLVAGKAPAGHRRHRPAFRTIPKGLRPPAQGWRATPTLGARSEIESTPTALWLRSGARGRERMGLNRVAVGDVSRTMTQGRSCLATLGSGTESRWDSRTERDSASRSRFASTEMVGCFRRNIASGSAAGRGHVERRKSKDPKVPIGTTESCDWRMARAPSGRQKRWDSTCAFFRP